LFGEICISTDDRDVKNLCDKFHEGIRIVERSKKNSSDDATLNEVVAEVIEHYNKVGLTYDNICLLLPTAPLLNIEILKNSFQYFNDQNLDYLCSVSEYDYPIEKALRFEPSGKVSFLNPDKSRINSQKLNRYVHDAGQFYWFKFKSGMSITNKSGYIVPSIYSQDIDTINDWEVAELKFQLLNKLK